MFKLVIKWLFLFLMMVPLLIISYVFAPLIVCFAKDGHLPKWLSWFETFDNSLYGDRAWATHRIDVKSYWSQVKWIWRNPIGNFSYKYAGLMPKGFDPDGHFTCIGDRLTSNRSGDTGSGHSGVVYIRGSNCFLYYLVHQWGSSSRCVRVALGWKMFSEIDNEPRTKPAQLIFAANPVMGFVTGK